MQKINFDKKIFNWGYAYIYTLLQCIFLPGFIATVCIVVMSATAKEAFTIPIPEVVFYPVVSYIFISFIGFPIVSVIKVGYRRLVAWSTVTYDDETIIYDKLAEYHWTEVGHVEEHHIYTVSKIDSITTTKFSYVINGSIEKVVLNNGRFLKSKSVRTVKIPNAYIDFPTFNAENSTLQKSSKQ